MNAALETFPLSFAQERLWFLDRMQPGSAVYNIPTALRMQFPLAGVVLQRALDEIVRRHEVLRTTFQTRDGRPVQVVAPYGSVPLGYADLRGWPPGTALEHAQRLANEEAQRPFDLSRGPVIRGGIIQLGDADFMVLLTLHHIVADGWSMGVLFRELAALYGAFAGGRPSPLPELPLQYVDYAVWQRDRLKGDALHDDLAYWRAQLRGALPLLGLPVDRPRPPVQRFRGALETLAIDRDTSAGLKRLAQRNAATSFMVLLAAFDVLLARYAGETDVLVGTPVANRTRVDLEPLIGFFTNTLVLRTDLAGGPTFTELLGRVREMTLDAYAHQECPFERIVEEVQPERNLSHNPLFQVMFTLQVAPEPDGGAPGGEPQVNPLPGTAKFDLTLTLVDGPDGLSGAFEYDTDLFDRATVVRMIAHFKRLLAEIVREPDRRVADLALAGAGERRLLESWNATDDAYPATTLHALFEAQAERTPDAVAVAFEDTSLTYAELNARAGRVAHALRAHGVGPDVRAGICLERSAELVVALLGVLKAGGAYVPLDPDYPAERLRFMLEDSDVAVVLTSSALRARVAATGTAAAVLDIGALGELGAAPSAAPPPVTTPDHLAYVIYTSGSTGLPKGVMVAHRSVCNHLAWQQHAFPLGAADAVLHKTPFGFDVSVWELFWPLVTGAKLVVARPGGHRDPAYVADIVARERITVIYFVASGLAAYLAEESLRATTLRHVFCGGEPLSEQLARAVVASTGAELHNIYGPTEVTIDCTSWTVRADDPLPPPIGRPIANVRAYVLDDALRQVPVGIPGELYFGGAGVARGYLGRPALTAERFVPDPFGRPGARLYRTGDIGRFRADGALEFLGRGDDQVKLRGFRIELGEIESALVRHPDVRDAVVTVRDDDGEKRLVAYLTPAGDAPLSHHELRRFLLDVLPDYMVPAAYVELTSFPLTPSGKLDRRSLPVPELTRSAAAKEYTAPRTPAEEAVAAIWRDVLGIDRVGAHDHFFELGGHSLLATQIVSRMRDTLELDVPLRTIFEFPTVADLVEAVAERSAEDRAKLDRVALERSDGEHPLSFSQERLWFLDQLQPGLAVYTIPNAIRMQWPLDAFVLQRALDEIVRRHDVLRTTFDVRGGRPVQIVSPDARIPFAYGDLRGLPPPAALEQARLLANAEARRPFDLRRGPLLRPALMRVGDADFVLLLTMHHIAGDEWSTRVLMHELGVLYDAFSNGRSSPLPELGLQYTDYASWQRRRAEADDAFADDLTYWRAQLRGAPPVLELPADRARPLLQTFAGDEEPFEIDPATTAALKRLARRCNATMFMVLLAAFDVLLARYAGVDDVVVGSPIANRTRTELEPLIGFFANTLVLRTSLAGDPTFTALVDRVREMALAAYAHQDLPFERLVEELQPERRLSHNPLFQVMFFVHTPTGAADAGDAPAPISGTAKFDLTVGMSEIGDRLLGAFEYATDLFDRATVARMVTNFKEMLRAIAREPESRISALPLLAAEERAQLDRWNAHGAPYPSSTLAELIAAQAAQSPGTPAILDGDETITYAQLNERANRLAHFLRRRGAAPGVRVGLCLQRSPELLIALLAVLKSGAAYVPFDPAYPAERLRFMLDDSGAAVVLTHTAVRRRIPRSKADVVCVDTLAELDTMPAGDPPQLAHLDDLAYVIYTSGSTGTPKGVIVSHRVPLNLVVWQLRASRAGAGTRTLQYTSLSFDVSLQEIASTWCSGGVLVTIDEERRRDAVAFYRWCAERRVERLFVPYVALRQLAEGRKAAPLEPLALREIVCAGEQLEITRDIAELLAALPGCVLSNQYGPSETHIVTAYELTGAPASWSALPPIGRPIPNVSAHVLDASLKRVPIGVAGEIYIGGDALARGYLDRPGATADRFVPDPFSAGRRLYRTGDVGRFRADGALEYLGRRDDQVKVRGFRIELGEIEAVLGGHPAVRDAVVAVRAGESGDKLLVAYVTHANGAVAPSELRTFLRARLPEHMVPTAYVALGAMPLTPSGKVDRRGLPALEPARDDERRYVAPRTPIEAALAEIWAQVLGVERAGASDDFFDLGGHSLLATQVVSRVRDALGVELPVLRIFEFPTLGDLADAVVVERLAHLSGAESAALLGPSPAR